MRKLSLRTEDLHIQSFPTSAGPDLRGGTNVEMNTVGKTCGISPVAVDDPHGRDGTTAPRHCCV